MAVIQSEATVTHVLAVNTLRSRGNAYHLGIFNIGAWKTRETGPLSHSHLPTAPQGLTRVHRDRTWQRLSAHSLSTPTTANCSLQEGQLCDSPGSQLPCLPCEGSEPEEVTPREWNSLSCPMDTGRKHYVKAGEWFWL